jgi:short-subunit dehydrogenase
MAPGPHPLSGPRWPLALVTGASSGIGATFARRLAVAGSDLVVVARRGDRLDALAAELRAAHGIRVETLVADLSDPVQLATVESRLREGERPVDLLVNNAGAGGHGSYSSLPVDDVEAMVRLNLVAPVRLTSAALPVMVARGTGGILNVSSISGEQPIPFVATYAATKAFLTSLSESLHEELRGSGVTVTAVLPGFTHSEFHDRADMGRSIPRLLWMTADAVVDAALAAVAQGHAVCVPGFGYRLVVGLSRHAPRGLVRRVAGVVGRRT